MKFSTKEDIDAPVSYVYSRVSDFNTFERAALRRGADVRRTDMLSDFAVGSRWAIDFQFRGKQRAAIAAITDMHVNQSFSIAFQSGGIEGVTEIDLLPLSKTCTRVSVQLELKPKTLGARLMLQSLRLAKSNLTLKFRSRVADYAESVEDHFRKQA